MMRRSRWVTVLAAVLGTACSDALDQGSTAGQSVVVVNAGSGDVTLFEITRLISSSFALAPGVPTSVAALGPDLVVALGDSDAVQVADVAGPGQLIRLAEGSGALAVGIQNDSIAWVANPGHNTVTRINYRTSDTSSIPVGVFPQGVLIVGDRLFAVNGNLVAGAPAGPSWLSVKTIGDTLIPGPDSIGLTGTNARYAANGLDGFMYVVTGGSTGSADGRLSVVDPGIGREVAVINGLGESPGPPIYHPSGRLLIASPTEGILEVNTTRRSLERGPGAELPGIKPGGDGIIALAVDSRGRMYAVSGRSCMGAGALYVLSPPPDYGIIQILPTGECPSAAVLAGPLDGP